MTCNDCIHCEACQLHVPRTFWDSETFARDCQKYKDKNKIIELPCKVGDTVYVVQERYTECTVQGIPYGYSLCLCAGCEAECDSKLTHENKEVLVDGFEINSLGLEIILHSNWHLYPHDKRVSYTKAEAEEKLKELKK